MNSFQSAGPRQNGKGPWQTIMHSPSLSLFLSLCLSWLAVSISVSLFSGFLFSLILL